MVDEIPSPGSTGPRSPAGFLVWLATSQKPRIALGALLGSSWMLGLTLPPYLLSRAIDDGLVAGDPGALFLWVSLVLGTGLLNAALGILRHRTMTKIRMDASFRTVRATVHQATRLGATLPRRVTGGEISTIGMADVQVIAQTLTVTGPGVGAVVAYIAVAAVLFSISPVLAGIVLAGVPVLALLIGPLLHRLSSTDLEYREHNGALTARLVDTVSGLRVLNGFGGKHAIAERYVAQSRALRFKGYRVGAVTSWVGALGTGLPALFLAVVTWSGARMTATEAITIGDLVAVYGYVAVLAVPVSLFIEGGGDIARGLVSARRVTTFLDLVPEHTDTETVLDPPGPGADLHDPRSGTRVRGGSFTALACTRPADAAEIIDRLGRFSLSDSTWGGVPLERIALDRVRDRILVADNDADFFSGTVREVVAGRRRADDDGIRDALATSAATDVVEEMGEDLDSTVAPGARTLSGGQAQRLRLARTIYARPEVLLADDPTSALDARSEATVAAHLKAARRGLTTLVATTSPLVLDQADTVLYCDSGTVAAEGTHPGLISADPGYRALVARGAAAEVHR